MYPVRSAYIVEQPNGDDPLNIVGKAICPRCDNEAIVINDNGRESLSSLDYFSNHKKKEGDRHLCPNSGVFIKFL